MPALFTVGEMQNRLARLREDMARAGIDCTVATSVHNLMYLTGFFYGQPYGRHCAVLVPLEGEPALVSPKIEVGRVEAFSWFDDIRVYTDEESPLDGLTRLSTEFIRERSLEAGSIAVEEDSIPVAYWRALGSALPRATLADISDLLERRRMIKSPEEIELSRQIARICEAAIDALDGAIAEGRSEIEISAVGEAAMGQEYARRFPELDCLIGTFMFTSGSRIWGHHGPSAKRVERGELLKVGAQPMVMGYFGTITRRRVVGEIPSVMARIHSIVLEAMEQAIAGIRPGVPFAEIDRIVWNTYEQYGMAQYKGFGTGHSHGLMGPFWGREKAGEYRTYNQTLLQPGMITSMEPSLFVPGVGAYNLNDMILVTNSGAEVLTQRPRDLKSIAP